MMDNFFRTNFNIVTRVTMECFSFFFCIVPIIWRPFLVAQAIAVPYFSCVALMGKPKKQSKKRKAGLFFWFTRKRLSVLAGVLLIVVLIGFSYSNGVFSLNALGTQTPNSSPEPTVTATPDSSGGVDYWSDFFGDDDVSLDWSQDSDVLSLTDYYTGDVSGPDNWRVFLVAKYDVIDFMPDAYSGSGYTVEPMIAPDLPFDLGEPFWFLLSEGVTDSEGVYSFEESFFDEEYGYVMTGVISTKVLASASDSSGADVSMWLSSLDNLFSDAELAAASFVVSSNVEVFTLIDEGYMEL
jgi:hypothetical protein